jgi:RNA polymerase sigma-70 factor (ECF subfamily)
MVRDLETAEDLAQEVFSRAFTSLHGFRREASSRTWLLTIARNICVDYLRAKNREPSTGGRLEGSDPDHQPDDAPLPSDLVARRHQLKEALDSLGEVDRALIVLRYRHGLEYLELAQVFGLRSGTIRMRLSRALARMRVRLERPPREAPPPGAAAPLAPRAAATPRRAPALEPSRRPPPPSGQMPPSAAPSYAPLERGGAPAQLDRFFAEEVEPHLPAEAELAEPQAAQEEDLTTTPAPPPARRPPAAGGPPAGPAYSARRTVAQPGRPPMAPEPYDEAVEETPRPERGGAPPAPQGLTAPPARRPTVRDTLGPDLEDEDLAHAPTFDARRAAPSPGPSREPPMGPLARAARAPVPAGRLAGGAPPPTPPSLPTPPPAPAHAMGEALELLDPGLPIGLFERLLERVSAL